MLGLFILLSAQQIPLSPAPTSNQLVLEAPTVEPAARPAKPEPSIWTFKGITLGETLQQALDDQETFKGAAQTIAFCRSGESLFPTSRTDKKGRTHPIFRSSFNQQADEMHTVYCKQLIAGIDVGAPFELGTKPYDENGYGAAGNRAFFRDGRVAGINVDLTYFEFQQVEGDVIKRFGKPGDVTTKTSQNGYGATFTDPTDVWSLPKGQVTLSQWTKFEEGINGGYVKHIFLHVESIDEVILKKLIDKAVHSDTLR